MNRIKFAMSVAVAFFAFATVSAQSAGDIVAKYNEAAKLIEAKNFAGAIPILTEVIEKGGNVEGAEETVSSAKKYITTCWFMKGGSEIQGGKTDEALKSFTKAVELSDEYDDIATGNKAKMWVGRVVLKQGADAFNSKDYATAASVFEKGYKANPKDTTIAMNLAMSYCEMGELAKGGDVYKSMMELGGTHGKYESVAASAKNKYAYYYTLEAVKLSDEKKYAETEVLLDSALTVVPESAELNMLYLQTLNNTKQYDKLISAAPQAIDAQQTPELKGDATFLLGAAYQNKENYAKAIETYSQVTAGNSVETAKAQIEALSKIKK